jgi:hypothetical protein
MLHELHKLAGKTMADAARPTENALFNTSAAAGTLYDAALALWTIHEALSPAVALGRQAHVSGYLL